jgi:hypothetical protein
LSLFYSQQIFIFINFSYYLAMPHKLIIILFVHYSTIVVKIRVLTDTIIIKQFKQYYTIINQKTKKVIPLFIIRLI